MTNNITRRMWEHKSGQFEGFSSKHHCDRLVYFEGFDDVRNAIAREKQLKGWRRSRKIALIESRNPCWEDLAEKWGRQMAFAGESIKGRGPPARDRRAKKRTHRGSCGLVAPSLWRVAVGQRPTTMSYKPKTGSDLPSPGC